MEERLDIALEIYENEMSVLCMLEVVNDNLVKPFVSGDKEFRMLLENDFVVICIQFFQETTQIRSVLVEKYSEYLDVAKQVNTSTGLENFSFCPFLNQFLSLYACYRHVVRYQRGFIKALCDSKDTKVQECLERVDTCEAFERDGLSIQRIFPTLSGHLRRFKDLLTKLLDITPKTHSENSDLNLLVDKCKSVIDEHIKELKHRDQLHRLLELGNSFKDDPAIVYPNRELRLSDWMQIIGNSNEEKVIVHLFNDILLYSTQSQDKVLLSASRKIDLRRCVLEDVADSWKRKNAFQIITSRASFVLVAASKEQKQQWMSSISENIIASKLKAFSRISSNQRYSESVTQNNENLAPVWVPDAEASKCHICSHMFTVLKRRHHCRLCGNIVCKNCSPHRRVLRNIDSTGRQRICEQCVHRDVVKSEVSDPDLKNQWNNSDSLESLSPVLANWLKFETDHLNDLAVLCTVFVDPLLEASFAIASNPEMTFVYLETTGEFYEKDSLLIRKSIFDSRFVAFLNRVRTLRVLNGQLLDDMQRAVASGDVGALILQYLPLMRIYGNYARDMIHLVRILNSPQHQRIFSRLEQHPEALGLKFHELIIRPTICIHKHQVFLEQLSRELGPSADLTSVDTALETVRQVLDHWDNAMKEEENQRAIVQIESTFLEDIQLNQPGRELIISGTMLLSDEKFMPHFLVLHLFNDSILICKEQGARSHLLHQVSLRDVMVTDQKGYPQFKLKLLKNTYIAHPRDEAEKLKWVELIFNAIKAKALTGKSPSIEKIIPWASDWLESFSKEIDSYESRVQELQAKV